MSAAFASGCATQAELRTVRQDQKQVRGLLADNQVAVDNLRRRVDGLRAEIDELRGGGGGGQGGAQMERTAAALEARIAALEQQMSLGAPVPGVPEVGGTPAAGAPPGAVGDEAALSDPAVDQTYRDAYKLMRDGNYTEAVSRFREFLRRNPKSAYADDAQYWIGECYYGLKDYNQSILALNDVLTKYPKSEKVPAALLRQASAFADLGYKVDARLILQKLVSEHPGTREAEQARQELQKLGS